MHEKKIKLMEIEDVIFQCLHGKESVEPSLIEVNQVLDLFI